VDVVRFHHTFVALGAEEGGTVSYGRRSGWKEKEENLRGAFVNDVAFCGNLE